MATHAYQSLEPGGQIVTSDGPREDLEGLARWVSIPVPEKAPAEKKLTAAEKKAAKEAAEAEIARIAALPIHVGDAVKLNDEALGLAAAEPDATPEALEKASAWRGVVIEVRHDDADGDVATFEGEPPAAPVGYLEVIEPPAE